MSTQGLISRIFVLPVIAMSLVMNNQANSCANSIAITYDLNADGTGSSYVEELPRLGFGYQYPIIGNIRLTLDPARPYLENMNSDILPLPNPNVPAPYSAIVWYQPELFFVGEYLSDALSADVSMRFYLDPIVATIGPFAPLPPYELFVELTEGRSKLDLTGGYTGIALGSTGAPNSVLFSVQGRAIPEPAGGMMLLIGVLAIIANRRWQ